VTGLLHISDRLLAGELSRVEAARGTLQPLPIEWAAIFLRVEAPKRCMAHKLFCLKAYRIYFENF